LFARAAQKNDKTVMWFSVAGRALAVYVFLGDGGPWRNVAVYEGVCGALIAAALVWEGLRGEVKGKKS